MSRTCPRCGSDKIRSGTLHAHDGIRKLLFGETAWLTTDQHGGLPTAQAPVSLPHTRAEAGDAEAQLQMGMRYATGDGVVQNDKEAARWFERAARQGLAEAEYEYGLALLNGRGVVQDHQAAFE